jgi:diguanylate cyclase (GGDEF)-like protein/PAS domain S-box-containing protein
MQDKNESVEQFIKETVKQGFIEAIGDAVSIQATDFKVLYQNQAHKDIIGDHLGEYCYRAYEKRDHVCNGCPLAKTFESGGVYTKERSAPTDRGTIHVEITSSPLRDKTGKIIAGIEVVRDITKNKELLSLLMQAKEEWEETFDIINEAITIHDKNFNIIRANKAAEKIIGLPFHKMFSQKCYMSYHGTDSPPENCPSCNTLKTGVATNTEIFDPHLNKYLEIRALPRFDENTQIIGMVHVVRDISERRELEEQLRALTLTDELTGLYNRRGFMTLATQQLRIANRLKRGALLLFADLNDMKWINDTFGHQEGDLVLRETADILKNIFRESDIIARIGGDEFVVFPVDITDTSVEALNKRFQEYLEVHNAKRGRNYKLTMSIGIVNYEQECRYSIDELLDQADKLMYEKKRLRKF